MITHDLGVVAETADEVVVMYAAKVVEHAPVDELFTRPRHPYTWGLLGSMPHQGATVRRLTQIPGSPPSLLSPPPGCRFSPRCSYAMEICRGEPPQLNPAPTDANCLDACYLDEETKAREADRLLAEMMADISA